MASGLVENIIRRIRGQTKKNSCFGHIYLFWGSEGVVAGGRGVVYPSYTQMRWTNAIELSMRVIFVGRIPHYFYLQNKESLVDERKAV